MREVALLRGGKCLSTQYVNENTKLKWQCEYGHVWESTPNKVIACKRWCHICGGSKKKSINDMHKLAKERGGKCLAPEYKGMKTKLKWQCSKGHTWEAEPTNVQTGSWCPKCSNYFTERIVRKHFEDILSVLFNKSKPKWLKNSRGNQMELDGYNNELGIAFEYQGVQHYKEHIVFKDISLEQRQQDDKWKKKLCKQNGVLLIEVPYWIKRNHIRQYVLNQLVKHKVIDRQLSFQFDK